MKRQSGAEERGSPQFKGPTRQSSRAQTLPPSYFKLLRTVQPLPIHLSSSPSLLIFQHHGGRLPANCPVQDQSGRRSTRHPTPRSVGTTRCSRNRHLFVERSECSTARLQHVQDKLVALEQDKAGFIYSILRMRNAYRIFEAGTSYGVSTIYLLLASQQAQEDQLMESQHQMVWARRRRITRQMQLSNIWHSQQVSQRVPRTFSDSQC